MRIGFGLGPFYASTRIGGRKRRRRRQSYGQYKRARQRREAYAARYAAQSRRRSASSGSGGKAFKTLAMIVAGILVIGWPFDLRLGAWDLAVAIPWWGLLAFAVVLYRRKKSEAAAERERLAEAERLQHLARQAAELEEAEQSQAAELEELKQKQAAELEEAKRNGYLRLDDGEAWAWHGVTPDGRTCHHRHRSEQAARDCAVKLAKAQ